MNKNAAKRQNSPWYAHYPDDFEGGTSAMSLAAVGAFLRLLNHQFSHGFVPKNDEKICRILRAKLKEWRAVRDEILCKFEEDENGNLVNSRMDKERAIRGRIRDLKIEAGRKGNESRWKNDRTCDNSATRKPIADAIPDATVLGVASTSTTSSTSSESSPCVEDSSAREELPELDSEALAKQGKSLESISARLALPVENFIEHGKSLGLSEEKVRHWADSRVANGWNTAKGKSLTPVTWPADMAVFAAASQDIERRNNGKDHRHASRNDGTANAGRSSAFAGIGKRRP